MYKYAKLDAGESTGANKFLDINKSTFSVSQMNCINFFQNNSISKAFPLNTNLVNALL